MEIEVGVKHERQRRKRGSAKEKSTVTDTVPRSNNVTVCHCVGELWIIGGLALAGFVVELPFQ